MELTGLPVQPKSLCNALQFYFAVLGNVRKFFAPASLSPYAAPSLCQPYSSSVKLVNSIPWRSRSTTASGRKVPGDERQGAKTPIIDVIV